MLPLALLIPAMVSPDVTGAAQAMRAENQRLAAIRKAAQDGMCIAESEEARIAALGGGDAWKYGELTAKGFVTLASALQLGPHDVFFDAGSGLGRLVMQAARDFGVRRAIGIELSSSRHAHAVQSLRLESALASRVHFLEGDCADARLWDENLSECTVIFVSNLLFDSALNLRLKSCVEQHAPRARAVACLRKFSEGVLLEGFEEPIMLPCETSWSAPLALPADATWVAPRRGTSVYVYERRLQ